MNWLLFLALAAGPLEDLAPLRRGAPPVELSAASSPEVKGTECTFTKRTVNDPRVVWQWVARCPVEDVRLEGDGAQVGVRLYTQRSSWTLLVLDANRAVDVQELPEPTVAPTWVSRALLAKLKTQQAELSTLLARDSRDGSRAVASYDRGYERVRPGEHGPTNSPLFEKSPPPNTPTRAVWFTRDAQEPWVAWGADAGRLEFSLRAPGGETKSLFSRPGPSPRIEEFTHVTTAAGDVFSAMVGRQHLVLWPQLNGTFVPRVAGVDLAALPPTSSKPSTPPCEDRSETRVEESVTVPRLFTRGKAAWAVWLTTTTTSRWHLGPVLKLGATETRSCEWLLDQREDHPSTSVGRFTAEGQLEEQLRLPAPGVPYRMQLVESADDVTLAVASNGVVTVTRLKP